MHTITGDFGFLDSDTGSGFSSEIESCLEALRKMQPFNNLAILESFSQDFVR
ncbi:hypothetical protein B0T16DRAFT_420736 [Cercophora newfieldiana]|uniref:Uncharacterized protein n=1 Tax=Cercophora newfieldiana TaxID=92897 RepID=A0AA40CKN6_9PEZI|nr:hypothetical protein B0T16DRAFT_420736 [Cercophora newfieldiana]